MFLIIHIRKKIKYYTSVIQVSILTQNEVKQNKILHIHKLIQSTQRTKIKAH